MKEISITFYINSNFTVLYSNYNLDFLTSEFRSYIPINIVNTLNESISRIPFTIIDINEEDAYVSFITRGEKGLLVPTGLLYSVIKLLRRRIPSAVFIFKNSNQNIYPNSSELNPLLRENQTKAIRCLLKYKRGMVEAPTGSGKSWIIGEIIKLFINEICLVIVPTISLMYQMQKDLKDYLGIETGLLGDNKHEIKPITVAIIDTLYSKIRNNNSEVIKYLSKVSISLWDEVHKYSNSRGIIVSSFILQDVYRLGLSATLIVENPLLLESIVGRLHLKIPITDSIKKKEIMQPHIIFHDYDKLNPALNSAIINFKFTDIKIPKQRKIYAVLYNTYIVTNRNRNGKAAEIVYKHIKSNKENEPVLILVSRVGTSGGISHAEIFRDLLIELYGIELEILHGNHPVKKRKECYQSLEDKTIPGLIASDKILSEGVNVKSLTKLIILSGGKSKKNFLQRVGRILRIKEGKIQPIIHDFCDKESIFLNQTLNRIDHARENYPASVEVEAEI
jgi:superfamily II DNA or RNA helicase